MTPLHRSPRLVQAGALLAPAVIVQVCALMLGSGQVPAPAAAAVPVGASLDAVLAPAPAPVLTPRQQRALEYLRSRADVAPLRSPMAHDAVQAPVEPAAQGPAAAPAPPPPSGALPVPELRLTAILGNRRGGLAAINGRIFAPGDEVAPGWRLSGIESAGDRVVIASSDGQTAIVTLRRVQAD